jgi:hypothetical protein
MHDAARVRRGSDSVVHCRDVHNVPNAFAGNVDVGHVQWLSVEIAINSAGEKFPELRRATNQPAAKRSWLKILNAAYSPAKGRRELFEKKAAIGRECTILEQPSAIFEEL